MRWAEVAQTQPLQELARIPVHTPSAVLEAERGVEAWGIRMPHAEMAGRLAFQKQGRRSGEELFEGKEHGIHVAGAILNFKAFALGKTLRRVGIHAEWVLAMIFI